MGEIRKIRVIAADPVVPVPLITLPGRQAGTADETASAACDPGERGGES